MNAFAEPRDPIDALSESPEGPESPLSTALLALHFRALCRLRPSVEHLLRSPLNSIGLNLELLAVEVADLAEREERASASISEVVVALRNGYERLVESITSALATALPDRSHGIETLDLALLARQVAGLGEAEARLIHAGWQTEIPAGAITLDTRRDRLMPSLLLIVCSALEHAGPAARIHFSVRADRRVAEIEAEVEPCCEVADAAAAHDGRLGLALLAGQLGGSCTESTERGRFRIHFNLPRLFGAPAC